MTLVEIEQRFQKAQKAWNASGSTDHVKIINLGELLFAASDLIDALKDERDELLEEIENRAEAQRLRWAAFLPPERGGDL